MPQVEVNGANGLVNMDPVAASSFTSIEGLPIPEGVAYLVTDVETASPRSRSGAASVSNWRWMAARFPT